MDIKSMRIVKSLPSLLMIVALWTAPVGAGDLPGSEPTAPSKENTTRFSCYLGYRDGRKLSTDPRQKPGDVDEFMHGLRVALDLVAGTADSGNGDYSKGLGIGGRIAAFEKQRFPALDRARIADGFSAGLAGKEPACTDDEIKAAAKACSKFVKTPKAEDHPMLGKPAPKWEVGLWHQLPEKKESLDITGFKAKVYPDLVVELI